MIFIETNRSQATPTFQCCKWVWPGNEATPDPFPRERVGSGNETTGLGTRLGPSLLIESTDSNLVPRPHPLAMGLSQWLLVESARLLEISVSETFLK